MMTATRKMPAYYEMQLPDGTTAFRSLDDLLKDATARGEAIASLLKQAEVHELKCAELRDIARTLVREAADRGHGTK